MRSVTKFAWFSCLFMALIFTTSVRAQIQIGVQVGADIETDATVGGIVLRMPVSAVQVGLNLDYGKGDYSFDGFFGEEQTTVDFSILRINIPVSYPYPLGDSGSLSVFPFIAPGVYIWTPEEGFGDSESEISLDIGAGAQFKFIFVAVSLGVMEETPDYSVRVGGIFQIGGD